jgi:hypothetical protein
MHIHPRESILIQQLLSTTVLEPQVFVMISNNDIRVTSLSSVLSPHLLIYNSLSIYI